MPIPMVNEAGKWRFDSVAGRQEILLPPHRRERARRDRVCRGYVEAQDEYASAEARRGARQRSTRSEIISTPGRHDGLAWRNADGTWGGPVGEEYRSRHRRGLSRQVPAVPRLLFQGPEGARPSGAARQARLRRSGRDDRRLRARRRARELRGDRREDLHRQPRRRRVREGPRAKDARSCSARWSSSIRTRAGARSWRTDFRGSWLRPG